MRRMEEKCSHHDKSNKEKTTPTGTWTFLKKSLLFRIILIFIPPLLCFPHTYCPLFVHTLGF